jgi:hypothetical protein
MMDLCTISCSPTITEKDAGIEFLAMINRKDDKQT